MQNTTDSRADELLKDLASDYANYLITDTPTEWNKLESVIRKLSTNVEEFSSLLESINLDTSLCVDSLLPQIFSHYEQMKDTFNQIDTLEAGVKTVEASISSMELELSKAEAQLGSESVFKTVFRPFLRPSGVPMTHQTPCSYNQVAIFNTDEIWTIKEEP